MGIWIICQSFSSSSGLTEIVNNPAISDFDNSKTIDVKEALCLGFAISVDNLICGIGFSMGAESWVRLPFLVSIFQFIFLSFGIYLGKKIRSISSIPPAIFSRFAGIILILIGFMKMFI